MNGTHTLSAAALFGAALVLGSCSSNSPSQSRYVWVADGQPVNCINSTLINGYNVVNDSTIDFEMSGNRRYRNVLPFQCQDLAFGSRIRHNGRGMQLCSTDSISVLGLGPSATPMSRNCPLGQFQPLTRVQVPAAPAG